MKFVGHTMALPGVDIVNAIKVFSGMKLDGIEIVAQEGTPFHLGLPDQGIFEIIEASNRYNLPVITLTPYFWNINSADHSERKNNIDGLIRTIHLAEKMGAQYVRAYGGTDSAAGTEDDKFARAVDALKTAGKEAEQANITIVIENHPGTMTRTGLQTARMVEDVNMASVKALYDPCNVLYDTKEDWLTTLTSQTGKIGYIHCKDYKIINGERVACVVGEGIVPWREILAHLDKKDYYLSFEYEKRWYPDQLEDAETGLPRCLDYIRRVIK